MTLSNWRKSASSAMQMLRQIHNAGNLRVGSQDHGAGHCPESVMQSHLDREY